MTKLLFLGSGSAFTVGADNYQSNILLIHEQGDRLLIDCGSDIRLSLHAAGFSYLDITDIYISHLHSDHVGGMEYMAFTTKFDPRCQKPNLYISKDIAGTLWQNTLSGGLTSLQGDISDLESFFEVHKIAKNGHFNLQEIQFELVRTIHVDTGYYLMPSYGLFFELNGRKIFLTTDTQLQLEKMQDYYDRADIIFHDCETSKFPTPVHSHYNDLVKLPAEIKQKMWLYGYQPGPLPDATAAGFLGFVKRGQTFEFSDFTES